MAECWLEVCGGHEPGRRLLCVHESFAGDKEPNNMWNKFNPFPLSDAMLRNLLHRDGKGEL